jgi:hypothetical protein
MDMEKKKIGHGSGPLLHTIHIECCSVWCLQFSRGSGKTCCFQIVEKKGGVGSASGLGAWMQDATAKKSQKINLLLINFFGG